MSAHVLRTHEPLPSRWWTLALIGCVGSICVSVGGAVAGAGIRGEAPFYWQPPGRFIEHGPFLLPALVVTCGGLILLIRAWMRLRRYVLAGAGSARALAIVALLWCVPLALTPPLASRDVYAYVAYGEMVEAGLDPYESGPGLLDAPEVLEPVDPIYLDAPSVYGPVFMSASTTIAGMADGDVVASVLLYRLLGIAGLVLAALATWDITKRLGRNPLDAMMLGPLNPIVLYHLVSGAHNEAVMLGFLMLGVAVGRRPRWIHAGIVLCGLSAAIKIPGLLGAVFLVWPWALAASTNSRRIGRLLIGAVETLAVLALFSMATGWNWGWLTALANAKNVNAFLSVTQLTGSGFARVAGVDAETVLGILRPLGLALAVGFALAVLVRRPTSVERTLAWALLFFAMLHPTTQPWYFTWGLLLLGASTAGTRNRTLVAFSAIACFFVPPLGPGLGFALIDGPGYVATGLGVVILFGLTISPQQLVPVRRRRSLEPAAGPARIISRNDDDITTLAMLDGHHSNRLVCVMRSDSVWEQPLRDELVGGAGVVIAPKEWNRLGRWVGWIAGRSFPGRLRGLDSLSSTYGLALGAIDLNRLEPDGNALLVEVLVTHPELDVVVLPGRADPESLHTVDAVRFLVHLADLKLRGSRLWSGVAGARWQAR